MKKTILFLAAVAGLTAMAAQVILIREFLIVFSGDELSVGLVLCSWLASGAIGSIFLRSIAENIKSRLSVLWLCQVFLSLYLPISVFLVRSIRPVISANVGETLPFYVLAVSSFILLLPICTILGFIFPLLCRIYKEDSSSSSPRGIAKVYAFEAFGSMLGGLIASFILLRAFNSFQAIATLSMLNVSSGLILASFLPGKKADPLFINSFLLVGLLFLFMGGAGDRVNRHSLERQWPGYKLLDDRNTIYANLAVFGRGENQVSFFGNGARLYTVPDKQYAEESVNFCLLEHKNPKDVLLMGGGFAGLLSDILKHPVKDVVYVELDPELIKMSEMLLPRDYVLSLKDERVNIVNSDARLFVDNNTKKYDCIILDLGEPQNALINRFYTREFFKRVSQRLGSDGVFSFGIGASENYINAESANYLKSILFTLKSVFPEVKTIPGDKVYFLASPLKGSLTYDYNVLMQRARERNISLEYVREYYLADRLNPINIANLERLLGKDSKIMLNFDFRPATYYYGIVSWSSRFSNSLFTKLMRSVNIKIILYVFGIALISLFLFCARRASRSLLAVLAVGGFTQSVFQVILIFSFQVLHGYLFYKIGFLFAFFMLGLFIAGWLYSRIKLSLNQAYSRIARVQFIIALFSLFIPIVLLSKLRGDVIFLGLSLCAGLLGGYLFGVANQIYSAKFSKLGAAKVSGLTYGWDLVGACLGAALCAVFLIPIIGVTLTCILLGVLNLVAVYLLIIARKTT